MLFSDNKNIELNNEDFNNLDNCQGLLQFNVPPLETDVKMEIEEEKEDIKDIDNKAIIKEDKNECNENESLSEKFNLLKNKKKKKNNKQSKKNIALSQPLPEVLDANLLISSEEFPDVMSMDEEKIKEECKKYGIKTSSISMKNLQKSLKEVYLFLSTSNK